jgi:hypothetical protein
MARSVSNLHPGVGALIVDFAGGGVLVALVIGVWAKADSAMNSNATTAISWQTWRNGVTVETRPC